MLSANLREKLGEVELGVSDGGFLLVFCLSGAPREAPRAPKGAPGEFQDPSKSPRRESKSCKRSPTRAQRPKEKPQDPS